ncbi:hypothetical protein HYG89_04750 [Acinetobacter sp. SwsAc5]|uniref:hypothetical protein n=1 Tax=Acinetobacter sp. SwsAc5 TaxID=2749438 RepID=UPI0015BF2068|nr:hypothetical protein [Acinetobacter sp. SwsAc5]NWK51874.1 hypothetical protein [Acinetobacter sp. SwsAc5]
MNLFEPNKFAQGTLVGCNGNAVSLISHFSQCARDSGWSSDEILKVANKAREADYNHLVACLMAHLSTNPDDFKVGILFDHVSAEQFEASLSKLEQYLCEQSKNGDGYPYNLTNPNSHHCKIAMAVSELIDRFDSGECFYQDDGIESVGSQAVFLERNTNTAISEMFGKLRSHMIEDANLYENFLANLLNQVLYIIDSEDDKDTNDDIHDYECDYGLRTCECCGVILHKDQFDDEYGEWRCQDCIEEVESDAEHDFEEDREYDYEP